MREKPFDPSDTELLRALHSRNSKNIRNPLIFLQKMASYSCFWRVPSSKILLQASLHRIYDLLTLVSFVLHRDPAKCICNRADKDNSCKDRTQVLDHKIKDLFSAEWFSF